MRRKIEWMAAISIFMLAVACATIPPKPITVADLSALKGHWEGVRDLQFGRSQNITPIFLEIANDTLPLKGKVTLYIFAGEEKRVYSFNQGQITPQGTLLLRFGEEDRMELNWFKEGDREKLAGSYLSRMREGRVTFTREK